MYSKTCPYCGAYLDPGEQCDCQKKQPETKKVIKAKEAATGTTYKRSKEVPKHEACYTQY